MKPGIKTCFQWWCKKYGSTGITCISQINMSSRNWKTHCKVAQGGIKNRIACRVQVIENDRNAIFHFIPSFQGIASAPSPSSWYTWYSSWQLRINCTTNQNKQNGYDYIVDSTFQKRPKDFLLIRERL